MQKEEVRCVVNCIMVLLNRNMQVIRDCTFNKKPVH